MIVFCAVSSMKSENHKEMALVLSKSIKKNTNLSLYCIYDGDDDDFSKNMISTGGNIVYHRMEYEPLLKKTADRKFGGNQEDWSIWKGAFLRLDIPLILDEIGVKDKNCFYVDCDTLFLKQPENLSTDTFLAGPEFSPNNWSYFNSGVIFYNNEYIKSSYPNFLNFCKQNDFDGERLGGPVDQGLLNGFYKDSYQRLPLQYNWKPYWGSISNATILHFHGPKPNNIEKIVNRDIDGTPSIYISLFNRNPNSYIEALSIWKRLKTE